MAERDSVALGLASGLGNAAFMLPTIAAVKMMGYRVALCVETDFNTVPLFSRCRYADEVLGPHAATNGHRLMCGQWRPASWGRQGGIAQYALRYPYTQSECESNFRIARVLGWHNRERPDCSDWCADLDRTPRWDVGIVPGSKSGIWLRKRWPGMATVAKHFIGRGLRVAVLGLQQDGVEEIPCERLDTADIAKLPDALAGCRVIVGTDSGPVHLASSLGVPVVVIYTGTSELKGDPVGPSRKILRPLPCRPCQTTPRWQACREWKCREIDPAEVIGAAEQFLG